MQNIKPIPDAEIETQYPELHAAHEARDEAIEALKAAADSLRLAAPATGLGPTDLACELGLTTIRQASDLLAAARLLRATGSSSLSRRRKSRTAGDRLRRQSQPANDAHFHKGVDITEEAKAPQASRRHLLTSATEEPPSFATGGPCS